MSTLKMEILVTSGVFKAADLPWEFLSIDARYMYQQ